MVFSSTEPEVQGAWCRLWPGIIDRLGHRVFQELIQKIMPKASTVTPFFVCLFAYANSFILNLDKLIHLAVLAPGRALGG